MTEDERRKAVLFNDITHAPLSGRGRLIFSDRLRLRDFLWEQGWRRDVRPKDVTSDSPSTDTQHGRGNGEDCAICSSKTLPYPFLCEEA